MLGDAYLFYEAQRSGALPADNRVPWRGNSCLQDGLGNHSLAGGWCAGARCGAGPLSPGRLCTRAWQRCKCK